jgi:hypothetical protein
VNVAEGCGRHQFLLVKPLPDGGADCGFVGR